MKNSDGSRRSKRPAAAGEIILVSTLLTLLVMAAGAFFYSQGYLLYYGDAQAHINISRSIIDSRTPGYDQIGTVWLPLLHVMCLPFVGNDSFWSTGLAGTFAVGCCFVIAGVFFYFLGKQAYRSRAAAVVAVACFALNPNVLYLAVIPMTEIVFAAGLAIMLLSLLRFRATQKKRFIVAAVGASWAMSLTRYDGWFLIPFASLWCAFFAERRRRVIFLVFVALASLVPLYWLAHNWWETGNMLDFYNGPDSAQAIQGAERYPGWRDWKLATLYYATAGQLCAGWPLVCLGVVGLATAITQRAVAAILFLALTPVFYIWSIYSAGTPIFVPPLPPYSYYNTRYGLAVVMLASFATGAIVLVLPQKWKKIAFVLVVISVFPWLLHPSQDAWVCWKESEVNSVARRAWTAAGASFMQAHYHRGNGILTSFGDLMGIFSLSRIPLCETLHKGNGPEWIAAIERPDLFTREKWAVAQNGDRVATGLSSGGSNGYEIVHRVKADGARELIIYEHSRQAPPIPIPGADQ